MIDFVYDDLKVNKSAFSSGRSNLDLIRDRVPNRPHELVQYSLRFLRAFTDTYITQKYSVRVVPRFLDQIVERLRRPTGCKKLLERNAFLVKLLEELAKCLVQLFGDFWCD